MVCYDRTIFVWDTTICNLESEGQKIKIWENHLKVVQMKFLAMQSNANQKLSFDIFTVEIYFMEHDLYLIS